MINYPARLHGFVNKDDGSNCEIIKISFLTALSMPKRGRVTPSKILISGTSVEFPYSKPYASQKKLMMNVVRALRKKQNALLESPTGSGKSLALLCATLAVNNSTGDKSRPVLMSSRTHVQLKQLVGEVKSSSYTPVAIVLASREHYCINRDALATVDVKQACHRINMTGGCKFKKNVHEVYKSVSLCDKSSGNSIVDIEDLVELGRKVNGCPFYAAKEIAKKAEVVFLPYDYLFSPISRRRVSSTDAIVIIDEGHNIPEFCCQSGSVVIDHGALYALIPRLATPLNAFASNLLAVFDSDVSLDKTYRVLVDIFQQSELGVADIDRSLEQIDTLVETEIISEPLVETLESLWILIAFFHKSPPNSYGFFVLDGYLTVLSLDPAALFKHCVASASSVLVTSGTLSPMNLMESRLNTQFTYKYRSIDHVVGKERVFPTYIGTDPSTGTLLKAISNNFKVPNFKLVLGRLLVSLVKTTCSFGGILLFLPSYSVLNDFVHFWKSKEIWKELKSICEVYLEPTCGKTFDGVLREYCDNVNDGAGSLFIAVFRGKVSEGLNFSDSFARTVITVGIPYPKLDGPRVVLTRSYLNNLETGSGQEWYRAQAFMALNQAVGRCVRHSSDHGAIIMIDSRLIHDNWALSEWIRRLDPVSITNGPEFAEFTADLTNFLAGLQEPARRRTRWAELPKCVRLDLCHNLYTRPSAPSGVCLAPAEQ